MPSNHKPGKPGTCTCASCASTRQKEDIRATARLVCLIAARMTGLEAADALILLAGRDDAARVLRCAGDPAAADTAERAGLDTVDTASRDREVNRICAEVAKDPKKVLTPAEIMTLHIADGMPPYLAARAMCTPLAPVPWGDDPVRQQRAEAAQEADPGRELWRHDELLTAIDRGPAEAAATGATERGSEQA
jgi:hypothetical protein